jgi:hypothetical protein
LLGLSKPELVSTKLVSAKNFKAKQNRVLHHNLAALDFLGIIWIGELQGANTHSTKVCHMKLHILLLNTPSSQYTIVVNPGLNCHMLVPEKLAKPISFSKCSPDQYTMVLIATLFFLLLLNRMAGMMNTYI